MNPFDQEQNPDHFMTWQHAYESGLSPDDNPYTHIDDELAVVWNEGFKAKLKAVQGQTKAQEPKSEPRKPGRPPKRSRIDSEGQTTASPSSGITEEESSTEGDLEGYSTEVLEKEYFKRKAVELRLIKAQRQEIVDLLNKLDSDVTRLELILKDNS